MISRTQIFISLIFAALVWIIWLTWLTWLGWPAGGNDIDSNFRATHVYKHKQADTHSKLEQCTDGQMKTIGEQLKFDTCVGHNWYQCGISEATRCPQNKWLEESYKDGLPDFLGVVVGCNKAYDAIDTARMGMSNPAFDTLKWSVIMESLGMHDGGACRQKSNSMFVLKPEVDISKGEMHCIEPMPTTVQNLKNGASTMNLAKEGFIIHHAAISSVDGLIAFPKAGKHGKVGAEDMGMDECKKPNMEKWCEDVPMFSLQSYVDTYVKSSGPINILSIDVEGFDFDVLFGAGSALDRTEYLEFEFHVVGTWATHHLSDAVDLLDGKGFNCYWAGTGKLWRINGCMHDMYSTWHGWSNVACVHRSHVSLSKTMERIFLETLAA